MPPFDSRFSLHAGPAAEPPSQRLPAATRQRRLALEATMDLSPTMAVDGLERWRRRLRLAPQELVLGLLRLTGVCRGGPDDFAELHIRTNDLPLPQLAAGLTGRRLLQVSDLHTDLNPAVVDAVATLVATCDNLDATVLTGDYRCRATGRTEVALAGLAELLPSLPRPILAILGNHDTLAVADWLAAQGVCVLLNESVQLVAGDDVLTIAGVDDAHYFGTDNLEAVTPTTGPSILLAHTPATANQSLAAEFDYLLCGHTHGGQICLPSGRPIRTHKGVAANAVKGPWQVGRVRGYTCPGAGGSGISWRLNCPPAITVHELSSGDA